MITTKMTPNQTTKGETKMTTTKMTYSQEVERRAAFDAHDAAWKDLCKYPQSRKQWQARKSAYEAAKKNLAKWEAR